MRDLLIVGGGPAGLVTALHARAAGLSVAVVERRAGPVDKACGEGLMPSAVRALRALDVSVGGRPFRGIAYLADGRAAMARFSGGEGHGVRRTELHSALLRAADAAGVEIVTARVGELRIGPAEVRAAGLRGRYLVGADGLHSRVRRAIGAERPAGRHRRWGQRAHFACVPWTDVVEVHWSPDAEAYVTPIGADCVGVAVLSEHRRPFAELLTGFPALGRRLPAVPATPVLGAGPLRQRVATRTAGRALLVGDAAGYVDALTGEGLAIAFACAEALVHRVVTDEPHAYEADFRRITRAYRLLTSGLVAATRLRPLRRRIVPAAERLPAAFGAVVDRLAG